MHCIWKNTREESYFIIYFCLILYAYKVPRKLQNIYHFIEKASKCYGANTRAFAANKTHASVAGCSRRCTFTVHTDSRYLTFVPRKARIHDFLYTKAPFKKFSAHKTPTVSMTLLYLNKIKVHFKAKHLKWLWTKKVPVPTHKDKTQTHNNKSLTADMFASEFPPDMVHLCPYFKYLANIHGVKGHSLMKREVS